jgi:hypothetical protein
MIQSWLYQQPLGRKVERLPPEVFVPIGSVLPTVVLQTVAACQSKCTVHSLCIDDIHVIIRGHELILAMMVLASTLQVFWSIKPAGADAYMLLVKRTHLQNPRFLV